MKNKNLIYEPACGFITCNDIAWSSMRTPTPTDTFFILITTLANSSSERLYFSARISFIQASVFDISLSRDGIETSSGLRIISSGIIPLSS